MPPPWLEFVLSAVSSCFVLAEIPATNVFGSISQFIQDKTCFGLKSVWYPPGLCLAYYSSSVQWVLTQQFIIWGREQLFKKWKRNICFLIWRLHMKTVLKTLQWSIIIWKLKCCLAHSSHGLQSVIFLNKAAATKAVSCWLYYVENRCQAWKQ